MNIQTRYPRGAETLPLSYLGVSVPRELDWLLSLCSRIIYDAIGHPKAPTACVFTSLVLSDALAAMGIDARPVAAAVEGRGPKGRFGIGHPGYPLIRPGAWEGHLVCMVGDTMIDPTIGQARRAGVDAPPLVAVRGGKPWVPDAVLKLPSDGILIWRAEGANRGWKALPDAQPALRSAAVRRLVMRLRREAAWYRQAGVAIPWADATD